MTSGSDRRRGGEGASDILREAEARFDRAIRAFEDLAERIASGALVCPREAERTAHAYHAAAETLYRLRRGMHDELGRAGAGDGQAGPDGALDLDAARDQVRRQLDRLRAARGAGDVPDGT